MKFIFLNLYMSKRQIHSFIEAVWIITDFLLDFVDLNKYVC